MKKIKFKYIILIILITIIASGCSIFKRDTMEDITIVTTSYANEYVIDYLYGKNAVINSIYPDDTNIDNYTFTEKQIKDNSEKDLFIYMGKTKDSDIAIKYLNHNKNLKLIDATFGMEYENGVEELWLNPSNLLMISQNIKNGLCEYITSSYLIKEIQDNYEKLKIELSELDADIRLSFENANKKTIFTNNQSLNFFKKYGLNIIIINEKDSQYEKNINLLKKSIENNETKNFYILEYTDVSNDLKKLIDEKKINALTIRNIKNITDDERNNDIDYISLSKQNLELLKKELY